MSLNKFGIYYFILSWKGALQQAQQQIQQAQQDVAALQREHQRILQENQRLNRRRNGRIVMLLTSVAFVLRQIQALKIQTKSKWYGKILFLAFRFIYKLSKNTFNIDGPFNRLR